MSDRVIIHGRDFIKSFRDRFPELNIPEKITSLKIEASATSAVDVAVVFYASEEKELPL